MKRTLVISWGLLAAMLLMAAPALAQEGLVPELKQPDAMTSDEQPQAEPAVEQESAPTEQAAPAQEEPATESEPEQIQVPDAIPEPEPITGMDGFEDLQAAEESAAVLAEKEQVSFFQLNGYFRFRADLFHNLDIGVYDGLRPLGDKATTTALQNQWTDKTRTDNTIGTANMRLRLLPTLNVSEDIRIYMQVDVLDNIVLGSTPDTYLRGGPGGMAQGISGFSTAQVPPVSGANAAVDSIMVRRVWAEVRTPVGLLRFGRMPSHWGTGMFINDGMCLDCDNGDTVDRLLFGTKLFEHVLFVGLDFVNEGVTNETNFTYMGQAKDATQLDDVQQIVFGVARKHSDAEAEELLENGSFVLDYGFYNVVRWQSYSLEQSTTGGGSVPFGQTPAGDFAQRQKLRALLLERNLQMYIGDIWLKLLWDHLHVEFEAVWVHGTLGDAAKDSGEQQVNEQQGITDNSIAIDQYGMVFKIDYKFLDDSLFVGAEWGLASGDAYHGQGFDTGFGVYPYQNRQFSDGKYQRTKYGPSVEDRAVTNFRFDNDYIVDMILFREIIGTVTDATYVKPSIMYNIIPNVGVRADVIISWAMEADSTPSYYHMKFESLDDVRNGLPVERKTSRYMGTELDLEVFYKSFDGFGTRLQYGVFFPGAAFGYWDENAVNADGNKEPMWFYAPNIAQSLQWHLFIEF
jgi:uncharacterized protein (TIGR04551 family)